MGQTYILSSLQLVGGRTIKVMKDSPTIQMWPHQIRETSLSHIHIIITTAGIHINARNGNPPLKTN